MKFVAQSGTICIVEKKTKNTDGRVLLLIKLQVPYAPWIIEGSKLMVKLRPLEQSQDFLWWLLATTYSKK